jgi:hypothetical protein
MDDDLISLEEVADRFFTDPDTLYRVIQLHPEVDLLVKKDDLKDFMEYCFDVTEENLYLATDQ